MGSNPILSAIFNIKIQRTASGVVLKLVTGFFYECCLRQRKRVKKGAAVEIFRRSKTLKNFGHRKRARSRGTFKNLILEYNVQHLE